MRFYNNSHSYYCSIDLHARLLYVFIIDSKGEVVAHKKIGADKDDLLLILEPYIGNVIVGVECMHFSIGCQIGVLNLGLISFSAMRCI